MDGVFFTPKPILIHRRNEERPVMNNVLSDDEPQERGWEEMSESNSLPLDLCKQGKNTYIDKATQLPPVTQSSLLPHTSYPSFHKDLPVGKIFFLKQRIKMLMFLEPQTHLRDTGYRSAHGKSTEQTFWLKNACAICIHPGFPGWMCLNCFPVSACITPQSSSQAVFPEDQGLLGAWSPGHHSDQRLQILSFDSSQVPLTVVW